MSNYQGKLLELIEIKNSSGRYCLHVKVSSENNIEILWDIDEYTAKNLQTLIQSDKKYKYRLSFNSSWNVIGKQYTGILSRTYLDQSEKLRFLCSEEYISHLQVIKHSQNIMDLDINFFEPINIPDTHPPKDTKYIHQVKLNFLSIIPNCILFLILFNFFSPTYLNKIESKNQIVSHPVLLGEEPSQHNGVAENISPNQSFIHFSETNHEPSQPILYSVPTGTVALTFEGGPTRHSTGIMNILNKYKVGGTFFFTGSKVNQYPHHVKNIYSNGYSIGSHGMNHLYLPNLSYQQQKKELLESMELIEKIVNDSMVLFRPPYGAHNEDTESLVNEYGYQMILWNNDPEDWKSHNPDKIYNHIKNSNISGSIIILHETQAVLDALPRIIEYLQTLNLQIISL